MQCVTYGTVILLLSILTIITALIAVFVSPAVGVLIYLVAQLGLFIWWVAGIFNECEEGYYLNPRLKKMSQEEAREFHSPALPTQPASPPM